MEIDGPLTTTSEVISRLSEHSGYDLIFSDIRLRGQEVFSAFQTVMPECMVIFTTAYDEYALKAFKSNGVDTFSSLLIMKAFLLRLRKRRALQERMFQARAVLMLPSANSGPTGSAY